MRVTPLGALARGLVAGVVGTGLMTGCQMLVQRLQSSGSEGGSGGSDDGRDPEARWEQAPAPAKVARRILEGVFEREVPPERIGLLTNVTHWAYGTLWGGVYGLLQGTLRANPLRHGLAFGGGVWTMSYVQLVPMGLYEPPWRYPPPTVLTDLSYHLVYGLGVAGAYAILE